MSLLPGWRMAAPNDRLIGCFLLLSLSKRFLKNG